MKNEEAHDKLVGCSPSPQCGLTRSRSFGPRGPSALPNSFCCFPKQQKSPPGRGGDLARFWVQESATTSATVGSRTDCGDEPSPPRRRWFPDRRCAKPAVCGARRDENLAKLNPIKVDQGEIFKNKGTETEPAGFPRSWENSRPQSVPLRAGQSLSRRDRLYQPWVDGDGWEARKRYPGSPALCSRRRGTATGKLAGAGRSGPGQPDSMGVYGT